MRATSMVLLLVPAGTGIVPKIRNFIYCKSQKNLAKRVIQGIEGPVLRAWWKEVLLLGFQKRPVSTSSEAFKA